MTLRNSTFMHELPIHNRFPFFLYPAVSRFAVVGSSVLYIIPKDRKPVGVRQSSKSHGIPTPPLSALHDTTRRQLLATARQIAHRVVSRSVLSLPSS